MTVVSGVAVFNGYNRMYGSMRTNRYYYTISSPAHESTLFQDDGIWMVSGMKWNTALMH